MAAVSSASGLRAFQRSTPCAQRVVRRTSQRLIRLQCGRLFQASVHAYRAGLSVIRDSVSRADIIVRSVRHVQVPCRSHFAKSAENRHMPPSPRTVIRCDKVGPIRPGPIRCLGKRGRRSQDSAARTLSTSIPSSRAFFSRRRRNERPSGGGNSGQGRVSPTKGKHAFNTLIWSVNPTDVKERRGTSRRSYSSAPAGSEW